MINIGFFTGSRAEFGLSIDLIKKLNKTGLFKIKTYPMGLHLLEKFGNTVDEIKSTNVEIGETIDSYTGLNNKKILEFTNSIDLVYKCLKKDKLDAVLVIGDRLEPYSVALAAHFLRIKIIHIGGGTVTKGALDNIYRYNISNLSDIHFATSKKNYRRLKKIPILNKSKIFFSGATAIYQLNKFLKAPHGINKYIENLSKKYCLLTFHPVTKKNEPINELMEFCIKRLLKSKYRVLITYPNNDKGFEYILNTIEKWKKNPNVFICKNLGIPAYYSAIYSSEFIIGNSSSGIIEAPYFKKNVLDVGSRQEGRDKDVSIYNTDANIKSLSAQLDRFINKELTSPKCNELYGNGKSNEIISGVLKKEFYE